MVTERVVNNRPDRKNAPMNRKQVAERPNGFLLVGALFKISHRHDHANLGVP
jgi:hypothetical protein